MLCKVTRCTGCHYEVNSAVCIDSLVSLPEGQWCWWHVLWSHLVLWLGGQTHCTLHTSALPWCCHQASTGGTPPVVKGKWLKDLQAIHDHCSLAVIQPLHSPPGLTTSQSPHTLSHRPSSRSLDRWSSLEPGQWWTPSIACSPVCVCGALIFHIW